VVVARSVEVIRNLMLQPIPDRSRARVPCLRGWFERRRRGDSKNASSRLYAAEAEATSFPVAQNPGASISFAIFIEESLKI